VSSNEDANIVADDPIEEDPSDTGTLVEDKDSISEDAHVVPNQRYNLRPSRERSYMHRLDHKIDAHTNSKSYMDRAQLLQTKVRSVVTAFVLTQMSVSKGMKLFGQPAIDAILTEFCQLHDMDVFELACFYPHE
jgi:hypothetical protein